SNELLESAEISLEGGRRLRLVLEKGGWRIREGGFEPARFDTPELALQSFFAAAMASRWPIVRRAIPKRYADALITDEALQEHVAEMKPRIERAKSAVGQL